jgi:hypothetical protein
MNVKTANAGLLLPDFGESTDVNAAANLAAIDSAIGALQARSAGAAYTASGAITQKQGNVVLNGAGALAMTLAAPTATTDDYKVLKIQGITAHGHTVTTPSNGLNGSKHIATFANAGDSIELMAYQGVWYVLGTTTTTLS